MIKMTKAEIGASYRLAEKVHAQAPNANPQAGVLARTVLHLSEQVDRNASLLELATLAIADAEERCAAKLVEARTTIAELTERLARQNDERAHQLDIGPS
jgi:hypothetical protein